MCTSNCKSIIFAAMNILLLPSAHAYEDPAEKVEKSKSFQLSRSKSSSSSSAREKDRQNKAEIEEALRNAGLLEIVTKAHGKISQIEDLEMRMQVNNFLRSFIDNREQERRHSSERSVSVAVIRAQST
jgi:hypothetical protein